MSNTETQIKIKLAKDFANAVKGEEITVSKSVADKLAATGYVQTITRKADTIVRKV